MNSLAINLQVITALVLLQYSTTGQCASNTRLKPVITQDRIQLADFPIVERYTYVDKTRFVVKLLNDAQSRYFFSRPRRFGKTMFLRTLWVQAALDHHRNGQLILQGTDIDKDPHYKWDNFPIMYFDLSGGTLEDSVNRELIDFRQAEGIEDIPKECVYEPGRKKQERLPPIQVQQFREIVCVMRKRRSSIVFLVDEYDYHILNDVDHPTDYNNTVDFLKTFFMTVKRNTDQFKLAFVTGLTRSSFILFNSPGGDFVDISANLDYGELAGFTKSELKEYFQGYIEKVATERNLSSEKIEEELKEWYEGYAFTIGMESLYNPMSVGRYFDDCVPDVYWGDEGRGSFVWNQINRRISDFRGIKNGMTSTLPLVPNVNHAYPETLLFEGGYMCLKGVVGPRQYKIGFPNKEVEHAFLEDQVNVAKFAKENSIEPEIRTMTGAIHQPIPNLNSFLVAADTAIMKLLHPYDSEKGYQINLYYIMRACNVNVQLEHAVRGKEIDIKGETRYTLLHFEIKLKSEGLKRTWNHTEISARHFLQKKKNVLSATLLFGGTQENDTVLGGWYGELYSSEGDVLKTYYQRRIRHGLRNTN